ncbi:caspase b-like [Halichoeres trimaculatus]|uniref:caspase b-like n=1 Tax=Halichoeres trimaculatus TaxID=147232 RepID=UPI003D9E5D2B
MPSQKILLFRALEDLSKYDFDKFKMYLNTEISDLWEPIAKGLLETESRIKIADTMVGQYGEKSALSLAVEILRLIPNNEAAERLERTLKEEKTPAASTSSSSAAASSAAPAPGPGNISAQGGGLVIAPSLVGGTTGAWNVTINHK